MRRIQLVPLLLLAAITLFFTRGAFAQTRPELSGDIEFEDYEEKRNSYADSQNEAIDYFSGLESLAERLAQGSVSAPAPLSENVLFYLTGVYLYCSVNSGTCPLVLEGIAEADLMHSVVGGTPSCPGMRLFWKLWVKNGMEERHKYLVKTGHLKASADFNAMVRPKFIKCEDLIRDRIAKLKTKESFFRERYAPGSEARSNITKMARFLEQLKLKVPNVFVATGASGVQHLAK